ncbi:MAG: sugar phosphate isomerase/epimerase [Planctomycetota bacterium]|nr:sugar phosphate isomerase/epimerase [Planctomycetota bacterium]
MRYAMMTCSLVRAFPKGGPIDMKAVLDLVADMKLAGLEQDTLHGYAPRDLKAMAHDRGVTIFNYTENAPFACPPGERRTAAMDRFKQVLDDALALGSPRLMLPVPGHADVPRAQSRAWAIECLAEAVPLGLAAGVAVSTEHFAAHTSPFIVSDDIEEAVRAIPDLRVTFDNGNVFTAGEDPVHAFNRHKERIDIVHLKDWDRTEQGWVQGLSGKSFRPALIGQGVIDYPAMMRALLDAKFAGYVNLEYEDSRIPPMQAVRQAHAFLLNLEQELAAARA